MSPASWVESVDLIPVTTILRKGCDSYSHANPQTLKALGLSFCWRYLLGSSDKDLTAGEASALHAAGIDIVLNAEVDSTDSSGGFSQGVAYATTANNQADALGAPQTAVIVYSIDSARTADQVQPYFQGIRSVGRRRAGGYGGTEMVTMLAEGLITVWGQANAGSWSGQSSPNFPTHPLADFRQHLPVIVDGFSFDPQDQMTPSTACGFWSAPGNVAPPVTIPPILNPDPLVLEEEMANQFAYLGTLQQFWVDPQGNVQHRWATISGPWSSDETATTTSLDMADKAVPGTPVHVTLNAFGVANRIDLQIAAAGGGVIHCWYTAGPGAVWGHELVS